MLERFINEYSEKAFHFAHSLCGDVEESKELVQEAFFRIASRWEQYDSSQPLENWYYAILRNLYVDGLKRWERKNPSIDVPFSMEGEPVSYAEVIADSRDVDLLEQMERQDASEYVRGAIEELKPEYRAILTLSDIQGLSYEKLSRVMDCELGTVKSRVNRARMGLKKLLIKKSRKEAASYVVR